MCQCSREEPRRSRPVSTFVSRNQQIVGAPQRQSTTPVSNFFNSLDPERLRIEQLRRESIRRSFGV
jgi:hypothetical protein